jgi:hypothetical protein
LFDLHTQLPPLHVSVSAHAWPHSPQLRGSSARLTQARPHAVAGEGQLQAPPTHPTPGGQARPHVPQFFGSVLGSTHASPQVTAVGPQTHVPPTHASVDAQAMPQPPQFVRLVSTSTHAPPHSTRGASHVQCPATQASALPHTVPHAPQFAGSVARSVHVPLQTRPAHGGEPHAGAPPVQLQSPALHTARRPALQRARAFRLSVPHDCSMAALQRRRLQDAAAADTGARARPTSTTRATTPATFGPIRRECSAKSGPRRRGITTHRRLRSAERDACGCDVPVASSRIGASPAEVLDGV